MMNENTNINQWRLRLDILTTIKNMGGHATGDGREISAAQVGPLTPNSTQVLLKIGTSKRCESRQSQLNVSVWCRMNSWSFVMNMSTALSPSERSEARPRKDVSKFEDYKTTRIERWAAIHKPLNGFRES